MVLDVASGLSGPEQVISTTVSQSLKIKMATPQLSNEVTLYAANVVPCTLTRKLECPQV